MLNSIQNQNNARPAFGCSKCDLGRLTLGFLEIKGANRIKAVRFLDKHAPAEGKDVYLSGSEKIHIPHNPLMAAVHSQAAGIFQLFE